MDQERGRESKLARAGGVDRSRRDARDGGRTATEHCWFNYVTMVSNMLHADFPKVFYKIYCIFLAVERVRVQTNIGILPWGEWQGERERERRINLS